MKTSPIWLVVLCALQPWVSAQDLEIVTADGRRFSAVVTGMSAGAEGRRLELSGGETVSLSAVIELHGAPPRIQAGVVVHLVGGDELHGLLRAGDSDGETFVVDSPVLGEVAIEVDRLREMVLQEDVRAADLRVPESAELDEAVFLPTPGSRLDSVVGMLHRFTESGVMFQEPHEDEPRLLRYRDLAGIALRGGFEREDPTSVQLTTRLGDSMGGELVRITDGIFEIQLEGQRVVKLSAGDIAALTFRGADRKFLADLVPEEVDESSYFDDGSEPLYPYRVDRSVTGSYLVAGDHTYGKGLGVHSRSRLTFRVPEGFSRFFGLVAVDDEVKGLGLRADVDVRVLRGDEVVFAESGLRSGNPAVPLGVLEVSAGDLVTLEVDFGKGMDLADRVDWLLPVFLR